MELGDHVEQMLEKFGISQERVTRWLGRPCNCEERKQKLNQLSITVKRFQRNQLSNLKSYFEKFLEEQ